MYDVLTSDNFVVYASNNYQNVQCQDVEEFYEDLNRFKYLKKLFNKYFETGVFNERLILNHIIIIYNVFGLEAGAKMMSYKMEERYWPLLNPILVFLGYAKKTELIDKEIDENVVAILGRIWWQEVS